MKKTIKKHKLSDKYSNKKVFGSPYWAWVLNNSQVYEEGEFIEDRQANPDSLPEEAGIFYINDQDRINQIKFKIKKHEMLRKLKNAIKKLSPRQMLIVTLLSQDFHTVRTIAEKLRLSKSLIHKEIEEIRNIVDKS